MGFLSPMVQVFCSFAVSPLVCGMGRLPDWYLAPGTHCGSDSGSVADPDSNGTAEKGADGDSGEVDTLWAKTDRGVWG